MRGRMELFFGAPFGAPETAAAEQALGLDAIPGGYYYATRAAPMGAVSAAVVEATFFGFSRAAVSAAVPAIWDIAAPERVLEEHEAAVDVVLARKLGAAADDQATAEAAVLVREVAEAADVHGRPLAAGLQGRPWPDAPASVIRHAMNLLREHRGDGHIASLVTARLDAPESHQLLAAGIAAECECHAALHTRADLSETLRTSRTHTRDAWAAATARLLARGLLDGDGRITDPGMALHTQIERETEDAAEGPWLALGDDGLARLDESLRPATRALAGRPPS
jgi:hypothetical protein